MRADPGYTLQGENSLATPRDAASKAALLGYSRCAAIDLAPNGIRVNCVAPGPTRTPLTAELFSNPATLAALVPETTRLLSQELATLLAPLVEARVIDRTVEAFAAALAIALGLGEAATITVSGPTALFERVADRPEVATLTLVHRPAEMLDLAVEIDGTAIETRLAAFRALLVEALA